MKTKALRTDLRHAFRAIRRTPGLSSLIVLSLALGLGATILGFHFVDAALLNPLPQLTESDDLVGLYRQSAQEPDQFLEFSLPDFEEYASQSVFSDAAAWARFDFVVSRGETSRKVSGLTTSDTYFTTLGAPSPTRGRYYGPEETGGDDALIAVLSHSAWTREFGGDPEIVGQSYRVNGTALTIVGVAPAGFRGTSLSQVPEFWVPLSTFRQIMSGPFAQLEGQFDRRQEWLGVVARKAPGVTLEAAQEAVAGVARNLAEIFPETNRDEAAVLVPIAQTAHGVGNWQTMKEYCWLVAGIALMALVVSVLNVSNLLFARSLARRNELGVRRLVGASTTQVMRLLGFETLILVVGGGFLGLLATRLAQPLLAGVDLPADTVLSVPGGVQADGRILVVSLSLILLVGLFLTLSSAVLAMGIDLAAVFREYAQASSRRRYGAQDLLLTFQVAVAIGVLIGASLLMKTVDNLRGVASDLFDQDALVASIDVSASGSKGLELTLFYEDLMSQVRSMPSVVEASAVSALPITRTGPSFNLSVGVEGSPFATDQIGIRHVMVDDRFFRGLGITPSSGRDFDDGDFGGGPGVLLLNESASQALFRGGEPLGQQIFLTPNDGPFTVVGVVPDLLYSDLREDPPPTLYLNRAQQEQSFLGSMLANSATLVIWTQGDPTAGVEDLRTVMASVGGGRVPLTDVSTLSGILDRETALERQTGLFLLAVGGLTLLLCLGGLYGLIEQAVLRRAREIGIRRCLGAGRAEGLRLVLRRVSLPLGLGVIMGLTLAVWGSQYVQTQLYGVPEIDPGLYSLVGICVSLAALLVAVFAGRKSLQIHPAEAVRGL